MGPKKTQPKKTKRATVGTEALPSPIKDVYPTINLSNDDTGDESEQLDITGGSFKTSYDETDNIGVYPDVSRHDDSSLRGNTSYNGSTSVSSSDYSPCASPTGRRGIHSPPQFSARTSARTTTKQRHGISPEVSPKKPQDNVEPSKADNSGTNSSLLYVSLLAVLIAVVSYYACVRSDLPADTPQTGTPHRETVKQRYTTLSKELSEQFKGQDADTWVRINAAVKRVIISEVRPATIIMMYNDNSKLTAHCLAAQLAKIITKVYQEKSEPGIINLTDSYGMSANDYKMYLDDEIQKYFRSGSKVVILQNLQDLYGNTAALLHGYCDTDNAPYKDAFYVLTLQVPDVVGGNRLETHVENVLQPAWEKDLGKDNFFALMSRISNSVVHVKREDVLSC